MSSNADKRALGEEGEVDFEDAPGADRIDVHLTPCHQGFVKIDFAGGSLLGPRARLPTKGLCRSTRL